MSTAPATASTILRRAVGVVEQGRAGAGLRDLAHGAAEVDVDDVGAGGGDHPRCLGHHRRLGAEDLDRQRVLVRADPEISERALVSMLDAGAGDHLGADQPCPEAASLAAERLDAHSRHRGQDDPRGDLNGPDPPALAQVEHDFHRVLQLY